MNEILNPFVPGAGAQPPELSGRDGFLESAKVLIARTVAKRYGKSFIAVGLRGVGKTVLLNRVRQEAESQGCRVIYVEAHEDKSLPLLLTPHLRRVLLELDRIGAINENVKKALRALRGFIGTIRVSTELGFSLEIEPEPGVADSGDIEVDLPELFVVLGRAANARNTTISIIIDEIQYLTTKELSALVMSIHRISQENLPIILMGAGLPLLVGKMGESKSYAERLFTFPEIDALNYPEACRALTEPVAQQNVTFDETALTQLFELTKGYPYFIQEWGYVTWNVAKQSPITIYDVNNATPRAIERLDESFFRVRFDRLTRREKQYLRAMAELGPGPHRSGDIAEKLHVRVQTLGPCRSNLISKGMIFSPSYGDTAFTVPLFDQYMKRVMPFVSWDGEE